MKRFSSIVILSAKLFLLGCVSCMGLLNVSFVLDGIDPCHGDQIENQESSDCPTCPIALENWAHDGLTSDTVETLLSVLEIKKSADFFSVFAPKFYVQNIQWRAPPLERYVLVPITKTIVLRI